MQAMASSPPDIANAFLSSPTSTRAPHFAAVHKNKKAFCEVQHQESEACCFQTVATIMIIDTESLEGNTSSKFCKVRQ